MKYQKISKHLLKKMTDAQVKNEYDKFEMFRAQVMDYYSILSDELWERLNKT